jgi:hypothetical protein
MLRLLDNHGTRATNELQRRRKHHENQDEHQSRQPMHRRLHDLS